MSGLAKPHAHNGWPDAPCRHRRNHQSGDPPCGLPRKASIHIRYPCDGCGRACWSIDERIRHAEGCRKIKAMGESR